MIFEPRKDEKQITSIKEGDVIHVSVHGGVCILRSHEKKLIPMKFVDDQWTSGHYFNIERGDGPNPKKHREVTHEYAWWIAKALAGIASLYVIDEYTLTPEGHHQFPITSVPPAQTPGVVIRD